VNLDPINALGNFILGWIQSGKTQEWIRLIFSLLASCFVTFWGVWGLTITSLYPTLGAMGAFVLGFAAACIAMSVAFIFNWLKNPLTKKIPLFFPAQIEMKLTEQLQREGMTSINTEKKP
jgi:hypothetical protein